MMSRFAREVPVATILSEDLWHGPLLGSTRMADDCEYISRARLEYRDGFRHAHLGEVAEPIVYAPGTTPLGSHRTRTR